jgi:uncharacterized protein
MAEHGETAIPSKRRPRWRRRVGLALLVSLLALVFGHGALIDLLAGHSARRVLRDPERGLSPAAQALLDRCLEGLDPSRQVDYHAHLAGQGDGSDCWVNPRLSSLAHPRDWVRFRCYLSAAGLSPGDSDGAFVEDLAGLVRAWPSASPPRVLLLPFDYHYGLDGARDLEHSEFHVPNDYALEVRDAHPDLFLAAASIHPYRTDAVAELERVAARGVRIIKWLPSAQGIDPASPRCDGFYEACARLGVSLLVHAGEEQAVDAEQDQALGNPLRLRRPLAAGVRVIVAHCASLGRDRDLDAPDSPRVPSFELFLRLMGEPAWEGLLFGEISTVTQRNRFPNVLAELLRRQDLHGRLVNGSDWPLPAVNVLYSTRALARARFLTPEEREALNEIYHHNPLLFDLCLKRTVRAPGSGEHFSAEVFHGKRGLGL